MEPPILPHSEHHCGWCPWFQGRVRVRGQMGPWLGKSWVGSEQQKAMQIEHFLQAGTAGGTVGKSSVRRRRCLPGRRPHRLIADSGCRLTAMCVPRVCCRGSEPGGYEGVGAFWRKWDWALKNRSGIGWEDGAGDVKSLLTQGYKEQNDLPSNHPQHSLVHAHRG